MVDGERTYRAAQPLEVRGEKVALASKLAV
jgi:hypothetical protein